MFSGSGVGFALYEGTLFKLKSLFFLMSTSSLFLCQYISYLGTTYPLKCFLSCTGECSYRPRMQEQNNSWEEAQGMEERKGDRVQVQFTEEWVYCKKNNIFFSILEAAEEKVTEKLENHEWYMTLNVRVGTSVLRILRYLGFGLLLPWVPPMNTLLTHFASDVSMLKNQEKTCLCLHSFLSGQ